MDRLSRRLNFVKSKGTGTALDVADLISDNIFKLYGLPDRTVSNRGIKFSSKVWISLMKRSAIRLKISMSRQPQTDGASIVMNRMLKSYLRRYRTYAKDDCSQLLSSAELTYDSIESECLERSPAERDLGWRPNALLDVICGKEVLVRSVNDYKNKAKN